jgi:hypothetical protein
LSHFSRDFSSIGGKKSRDLQSIGRALRTVVPLKNNELDKKLIMLSR